MGKIGEIWAKLGLKKDDFDKGLDQANSKAKGFGSSLKEMGAAAKAVWAAVGVAAVKAVKEFINSSQTMGDAWNRTIDGMKSGWSSFVQTVNRKGFWNTLARMANPETGQQLGAELRKAQLQGEAFSSAYDALFEVENAFNIATKRLGPRLNELYLKMMNTALSGGERAEAANEYRSILEPIYENRMQAYKKVMDEAIKLWTTEGGIAGLYTNEQIVELIQMMGTDEQKVKELYKPFYDAYQAKSDEKESFLVDAITAYYDASNALNETLRRVDRVAINAANIDTTAPATEEEQGMSYVDVIDGVMNDVIGRIESGKYQVESIWDDMLDLVDVEWETPELDISKTEESLQKLMDDWQTAQQEMQEFTDNLSSVLESGIEDSIYSLSEGLGQLAAGGDLQDFSANMLNQMASFAKKFGSMLIEFGVGALALRKLIMNPYTAIAAGAALVALGGIASQKAQAMTDSFTGSSSSGSSGSTSASEQNINTELTIHVVGRLDGKDILLSSERAKKYYSK